MILFGTSRLRKSPGPDLRINCRACGRQGVAASSFESEERMTMYFVPLPTQVERHVICSECGADRLSKLPLDELAERGPEESEWHLVPRVSLVAKALAIASVSLFCFPLVSLILGVTAMVMCGRSGGWPFRIGLLGALLNVLLWGGLLLRSALVEMNVL